MYSAVMGWIVSLRTTLRISADAGADSKTATATHCKIRRIVIFVIGSGSGRRNRETVARRPLQNTPTFICELRFSTAAETCGSRADGSEGGGTALQPGRSVLPVISRAPRS